MRLLLHLNAGRAGQTLPFNYQYPLSAAIYGIIERADADYAQFLHNQGYRQGGKSFKLFTFSDLNTPFRPQGDRMLLTTDRARLQVSFYVPQAAESFVRGLFLNRQLEVADRQSRVEFTIEQVETIDEGLAGLHVDEAGYAHALLEPLSPLVAGRKNERGNYDFLSPEDADFLYWLGHNWLEKWASVSGMDQDAMAKLEESMYLLALPVKKPLQQRVLSIKAGTPAETKIRGYKNFLLEVRAPVALIELALGGGLGLYNAMGCGCVGMNRSHQN